MLRQAMIDWLLIKIGHMYQSVLRQRTKQLVAYMQENITLQKGDVVFISSENYKFYGRIDRIQLSDDDGWFRMDFVALMDPPEPMAWALNIDQINGQPFKLDEEVYTITKLGWMNFNNEISPVGKIIDFASRRQSLLDRKKHE
jgi:hypothetical protein